METIGFIVLACWGASSLVALVLIFLYKKRGEMIKYDNPSPPPNDNEINISFESKEQLKRFIEMNIPLAISPKKPAKTTFVNPFTSQHARTKITEAIVDAIMKRKLNE